MYMVKRFLIDGALKIAIVNTDHKIKLSEIIDNLIPLTPENLESLQDEAKELNEYF